MGTDLELRLSRIVGEGRNVAVSFGDGELNGVRAPLVEIILEDGRLVEVPVNPQPGKKPSYQLIKDGETLYVDPSLHTLKVVDHSGQVLSQQKYSNR
ncbi:hypothetical protein HYY73_04335 [Candidatus Woesearchaeota archaeon]|nr:hypothetical protein [Candidatus Woesearchaeota archaeon]